MTNAHPINKSTSPHQRIVELGRLMDELLPSAASRLPPPDDEHLEAFLKPLEAWSDMEERGKTSLIRAFRLAPILQMTLRRVSLICIALSPVHMAKSSPMLQQMSQYPGFQPLLTNYNALDSLNAKGMAEVSKSSSDDHCLVANADQPLSSGRSALSRLHSPSSPSTRFSRTRPTSSRSRSSTRSMERQSPSRTRVSRPSRRTSSCSSLGQSGSTSRERSRRPTSGKSSGRCPCTMLRLVSCYSLFPANHA